MKKARQGEFPQHGYSRGSQPRSDDEPMPPAAIEHHAHAEHLAGQGQGREGVGRGLGCWHPSYPNRQPCMLTYIQAHHRPPQLHFCPPANNTHTHSRHLHEGCRHNGAADEQHVAHGAGMRRLGGAQVPHRARIQVALRAGGRADGLAVGCWAATESGEQPCSIAQRRRRNRANLRHGSVSRPLPGPAVTPARAPPTPTPPHLLVGDVGEVVVQPLQPLCHLLHLLHCACAAAEGRTRAGCSQGWHGCTHCAEPLPSRQTEERQRA